MMKSSRFGAALAAAAIACLSLSACAKHEEAPPVAALPPPPPPPPAPPPPPPSADDVLQGKLRQLGAIPGDDGWSLSFPNAQFKGTKVTFDADDQAKLDKIAALVNDTPTLRLVIQGYAAGKGSKAHKQQESQVHANAVLRDLTANGADEARVQALGKGDDQKDQRFTLNFSDAEGQFPPPASAAASR